MTTADNLDKLSKIVGGFEKSDWLAEAKARQVNSDEILARQKIALRILRTLRQTNTSQKQLAEMLNVSPQQVNKWVKGSENFAIGTIMKIQQALNIVLIEIVAPKQYMRTVRLVKRTNAYTYVKAVSVVHYLAQKQEEKIARSEKYTQPRRSAYA